MATSSSIKCPHCAYDLSGTEGSRCPECGGVFNRDAMLQPDPGALSFLRGLQYPAVALPMAIVGCFGIAAILSPERASHADFDTIPWLLLAAILTASWFFAWRGMRRGTDLVQAVSAVLLTLVSLVSIPVIAGIVFQLLHNSGGDR